MDAFKISCVTKNYNDVITHVGIDGKKYAVIDVVQWLLDKKYTIFTMKYGKVVLVYPRQNYQSKRWFLTTIPDGVLENNLGFLSSC